MIRSSSTFSSVMIAGSVELHPIKRKLISKKMNVVTKKYFFSYPLPPTHFHKNNERINPNDARNRHRSDCYLYYRYDEIMVAHSIPMYMIFHIHCDLSARHTHIAYDFSYTFRSFGPFHPHCIRYFIHISLFHPVSPTLYMIFHIHCAISTHFTHSVYDFSSSFRISGPCQFRFATAGDEIDHKIPNQNHRR